MKRLGIVRLEEFKLMSFALKKALGILHGHALDKLSRVCGTASYNDLRVLVVGRRQSEDGLASGTQEELLAAWRNRLSEVFGVRIEAVLGSDCVDLWFTKVFEPRTGSEKVPSEGDTFALNGIVDPMLEASNWHDAEFRAWVQGLVAQTPQPVRVDVRRRRNGGAVPGNDLTEVET